MKTRRVIVLMIGIGALFTTAGLIFCQWFLAELKVDGHFTPEDVRQIQREASHHRWEVMRLSLVKGNFRLFCGLCTANPTQGQVCETVAFPDWSSEDLETTTVPGAPSRAYVLSGRYEYGLKRTTNGWQVFSLRSH